MHSIALPCALPATFDLRQIVTGRPEGEHAPAPSSVLLDSVSLCVCTPRSPPASSAHELSDDSLCVCRPRARSGDAAAAAAASHGAASLALSAQLPSDVLCVCLPKPSSVRTHSPGGRGAAGLR